MEQIYSDIIDIFQAASAIASTGGFLYVIKGYARSKKLDQVKLAEDIYKELREAEKDLSNIQPLQKKDWAVKYFDTYEWLAFLINDKEIDAKSIKRFYKNEVISAYDDIFVKVFDEKERKKNDFYSEFTKLYKKYKNCK